MSNTSAFFREAGSGSTVVCIHASASSSGQWRLLMEALSDRFRVVAMDLYGYGKSPAWPVERELQLDDEIAEAPLAKEALTHTILRKTTAILKELAAGLLILSLAGGSFVTTTQAQTRRVIEVGCANGVSLNNMRDQ